MTATRKHRCLGVDEDLRHPIGRLYWQPGEREYHFDPGDEDYRGTERTLCGLVTDQDNVIGTWGIPLSDDALHHEWLVGIDPCKGCFVGDWWKKQGE